MLSLLFFLFSAVLVFFAVLVTCANNPVYAVLSLIMCFVSVSALMVLLGADYLAMILIIVYVGAVTVLFLFIVMMMNIKVEVIKGKIALFMIVTSVVIGVPVISWVINNSSIEYATVVSDTDASTVNSIGIALYSSFIFHFQVAGVILMVAMIGAIMLVMHDVPKKIKKSQIINKQVRRSSSIELIDVTSRQGVEID